MVKAVTIALDAMGGDHGPGVVVPAALEVLERRERLRVALVGNDETLRGEMERAGHAEHPRMFIVPASQTIGMDESPSQALRLKKDSSMRVAVNMVKDGDADAAVSAGNTGALMATARYVLKTLPGIDRPAICTTMPSVGGFSRMLDLGANVDCSAEHLFQFGVMGAVLAEALDGVDHPRVGLLNIGEEEIKGNDQVKQAAQILNESRLNYIGYVEGDDIFKGTADIIVCDGFVGNVALKTSEGVAHIIAHYMSEEFRRNPLTKLAGLVAMPVLRRFRRRIDPRQFNGASLLGLRGIVLKSHGGADTTAFAHAVETAMLEVDAAVPALIDERLDQLLSERQES